MRIPALDPEAYDMEMAFRTGGGKTVSVSCGFIID